MLAEWGKTGLGPALNWFKVFSSGLMSEDDKGAPHLQLPPWPANSCSPRAAVKPEWMRLDHPVYFAACARDHVCLAEPSAHIVRQFCTKATVETFDTGHWVQLEQPEKLNRALLAWLEKAVGK